MPRLKHLLRAVLVVVGTACLAHTAAPSLADFVKSQFVQQISTGLKDFRVCEFFSANDDKRPFFRKSFEMDPFSKAEGFESREIVLEYGAGKSARKAHLGILILRYADDRTALQVQDLLAKQGKYFKGTEVLTTYTAVPVAKSVLVVYSESALNERVQSFIAKISEQVKESGLR